MAIFMVFLISKELRPDAQPSHGKGRTNLSLREHEARVVTNDF